MTERRSRMLIHAYKLEWLGDGDHMRPEGQAELQAALDVVRRMVNAGAFGRDEEGQSIVVRLVGSGTSDPGTGGSGGDYCARLVREFHAYRPGDERPDELLAEGRAGSKSKPDPWVASVRRLARDIAEKAEYRAMGAEGDLARAKSADYVCRDALPMEWSWSDDGPRDPSDEDGIPF